MKRFLNISLIFFLMAFAIFAQPVIYPAMAQESGGEILKWDVETGTVELPLNLDASEDIRDKNMERFEPGTGGYFGFVSYLEPWEFLDLQLSYPDLAWHPLIPYYFGADPTLNSGFYTSGTTACWDNTGQLVVREYSVMEPPNPVFGATNWYVNRFNSRCWEDWMDEAIETQGDYLGGEQTGIGYFLRQVHLGGVIGGIRMKELLTQVNAKEVSIQRTFRDERIGVFYVPPTAYEWDIWVADLYVWVNMRNWKIERHEVDFLYGREFCEYYNQLWDIQPDISIFYLEWLPIRILNVLGETYDFEITNEEPVIGPDEYIEQDQWIKISGSKKDDTEDQTPPEDQDNDPPAE